MKLHHSKDMFVSVTIYTSYDFHHYHQLCGSCGADNMGVSTSQSTDACSNLSSQLTNDFLSKIIT
jgi:hypothetical protein